MDLKLKKKGNTVKRFLPLILLLGLVAMTHAHGISEADKQGIVEGGIIRYLWLGAIHMVTGYDHILFLFGVIFYLTGFKDILKYITVFTLGHSVTLIFATFFRITANYYLVDAVIALSVCYKAFDNLDGFRKYLKINPPNLPAMILLFGLIHGFGLSTRLQELPLGTEGLLKRILAFNLGVELGQVAALSALFLLLTGLRKSSSFAKAGVIANSMLMAAGVGLFIFQMSGFLRGGGHHHESAVESEDHGHSHGSATHSHGDEEHSHGDTISPPVSEAHSHGGEAHSHDAATHQDKPINLMRPAEGNDSETANPGSLIMEGEHAHSHEDGHPHTHSHEDGMPSKKPLKAPKVHSHEDGVPHTH